ncbi:MAG TPA: TetR/AcrR family transcriptional regulator [Burkholderiaceae bacterium]|nr:TetR/AcrR family transcriptional regulator [Burkholderiaceae bacterium]
MKPRSEKGAQTRLNIIRAASDLFHARGVAATSPDQVIEASGTGKGQFYYYFASKEGLVHAVLENYLEEIRAGRNPACAEIATWEDLERWFRVHLESHKHFGMTRGCPFGTIGSGVTEKDELVRQDLNLIFEVMRSNLAAFFIRERAAGGTSTQARPEEIADFCIAVVQGAMLMGKIKRDPRTVEAIIRTTLAHIRPGSAPTAHETGDFEPEQVAPMSEDEGALLRREVRELRHELELIRADSERVSASLHASLVGESDRQAAQAGRNEKEIDDKRPLRHSEQR